MGMKMLISKDELKTKKCMELIPLECLYCGKTHYRTKNIILRILKGKTVGPKKGCYCSNECKNKSKSTSQKVSCKQCNIEFIKSLSQIKLSKNDFCCKSCAATYNNTHKTFGTRRSKLEVWLELKLNQLYPNLEIQYNKKEIIKSELDIYIPSLKLAIELNGIFHYNPIYGNEKLNKIQLNDNLKQNACLNSKIELVTIDVSKLSYFKESNAMPYLDIITNIISSKLEPV